MALMRKSRSLAYNRTPGRIHTSKGSEHIRRAMKPHGESRSSLAGRATMNWKRRIPFRVDIGGVIQILGSALVQQARIGGPRVDPERTRRDRATPPDNARLPGPHRHQTGLGRATLQFRDDGVGLSVEDAETYLSTLGIGITGLIRGRSGSTTPDRAAARDKNLIGYFGIGLFERLYAGRTSRRREPQGTRR